MFRYSFQPKDNGSFHFRIGIDVIDDENIKNNLHSPNSMTCLVFNCIHSGIETELLILIFGGMHLGVENFNLSLYQW